MRRARLLLLPVFSLALLTAPAQPTPAPTEVRLGDSFVALPGPWKFTPGDSPQVNGSMLWASPSFDDGGWSNMDLHPASGEIDAAYGNPGYVSGWTARGFPHLSGFAWYRLRIHLANPSQPVWLKMPDHNDDAYQAFANGKYLGEFGQFTAKGVVCFRSRPLVFQLPAADEHGDILLAIRFYMEPSVLAGGTTPDSGGMHQAPLAGLHQQVEYIRSNEVTGRVLSVIASVFLGFMLLIAATAAFWIWLLDRPHNTYLWLTLALIFTATPAIVLLVAFFSYAIMQDASSLSLECLTTAGFICWIFFWRRWFRIPASRTADALIMVLAVAVFSTQLFVDLSPSATAPVILLVLRLRAICDLALGLMLFVTLLQGARQDRAGAVLALPPIILLTISLFSAELLLWFHIRTSFFPFGVQISVTDVALTLLILVVGALVARRFIGSQVSQRLERQTIDQELEQARELQQRVLVPEPVTSSLFTVETVYYPARTVGGDFFQIIQHADGSLLIVVGDVSGKGMAAAMLVAVLVGAVRTRADETSDPAAILHTLNDRMIGRAGDHFATCIAAHLRTDGTVAVANAGHIPPYRNGELLDIAGSIPLGIVSGTNYDAQTIQLNPGDHLTFLTDGVPEARNTAGELLGFYETAKLSPLEPEAIAQAAITFGQDDDITIVSMRLRTPA